MEVCSLFEESWLLFQPEKDVYHDYIEILVRLTFKHERIIEKNFFTIRGAVDLILGLLSQKI